MSVTAAAWDERANNDGHCSRRATTVPIGFRQSHKASSIASSPELPVSHANALAPMRVSHSTATQGC